jgi:hypothetical protein
MEILEKRIINGRNYEVYSYPTPYSKSHWAYEPGIVTTHIVLDNNVVDISYNNVKIYYTKNMLIQAVDKFVNDFILNNRDRMIEEILE